MRLSGNTPKQTLKNNSTHFDNSFFTRNLEAKLKQ